MDPIKILLHFLPLAIRIAREAAAAYQAHAAKTPDTNDDRAAAALMFLVVVLEDVARTTAVKQ